MKLLLTLLLLLFHANVTGKVIRHSQFPSSFFHFFLDSLMLFKDEKTKLGKLPYFKMIIQSYFKN